MVTLEVKSSDQTIDTPKCSLIDFVKVTMWGKFRINPGTLSAPPPTPSPLILSFLAK